MGESARLAPSSGCYVVSSTNLSSKSFKIRVNFWIEVLKSYRHMLPTSFLDNFHPLSMRCSLNLQLRSAHEKPQQPNRPDSHCLFLFVFCLIGRLHMNEGKWVSHFLGI